jgi:hypothetical protein
MVTVPIAKPVVAVVDVPVQIATEGYAIPQVVHVLSTLVRVKRVPTAAGELVTEPKTAILAEDPTEAAAVLVTQEPVSLQGPGAAVSLPLNVPLPALMVVAAEQHATIIVLI